MHGGKDYGTLFLIYGVLAGDLKYRHILISAVRAMFRCPLLSDYSLSFQFSIIPISSFTFEGAHLKIPEMLDNVRQ